MAQTIQPRAPLGVADGGTGATNQLGALNNLGVPLGTIEDVVAGTGLQGGGGGTSVELRVGLVPVLNGGTGATTIAAARTALQVPGLAGPTFIGIPRAPNPATNSNDTQIATTQWVRDHAATLTIDRITGGTF